LLPKPTFETPFYLTAQFKSISSAPSPLFSTTKLGDFNHRIEPLTAADHADVRGF